MSAENGEESEYGYFPLGEFLEMSMESVSDGAVAKIDIGPKHLNPNGVAHGGVIFSMIDTAMGKATMEVIPDGCFCATIEIQTRFLRPLMPGPAIAKVTVTKPGRSIVHLGAEVFDAADRLVASASGSFSVITPRDTA